MAALPPNLAERLLDGSPDAILICDPAGRMRYWNAAAERIFGFPATKALGLSMNLIIPERFRARHWAAWEATMRTGITRYGGGQLLAVPALHKDGRQISIEFSIQLVKDAGGVIEWVVAVIRDVTERYRHEKAQRARLKVLEAKIAGPVKAMPSADRFAAPIEAPSRIEPEKLADTRGTTGVLGGVEGGIEGGVVGGIVGGLSSALPPPPPPPAPPPAKPAPVRIGGQIMAPALVSRVDPVYPAIAQAAQLEGIVILEATVGETGGVESVKVLRSVGLLDAAAVEAVKQWRYSPLRLNDRPTSFVLTVTVQFHLANRPT